ncbi:unnamed protein product [Adineta ricciae]|uniref:Hint domain-containing protein n=1 Tax=Adineta ricciae TaxID=249248 RepID=A0A815A425_ADIRI|nr:unnamed protein product [Adineta ricciae]
MHFLHKIFIGFLILWNTDGYPYRHPGYGSPYHPSYDRGFRWEYSSSYSRYRCFSGDSVVRLSNGTYKQIDRLQSSDQILTREHSKVITTEMIMMLDKHTSGKALFYTLITYSGHQISLTEHHLIPIVDSNGNDTYLFAKHVQIGDQLIVLINDTLDYSPVMNITIEMKKQYYAPLTMTGTLFVNDIFASCFANVRDHRFAQYSMTPFRVYYKLARYLSIAEPFHTHQREGIHWTARMMLYFARYFRADVLIL